MVHSAVKRQSYLLQSESIVRLDEAVEQGRSSSFDIPCTQTNTCSLENPKDILQAILKYLSDTELFHLIITRLSKAAPRRAPLYLTTLCIEGVHDFFRPNRPLTDSVHLSGLGSPEAAVCNPFGRMSITRRDSERLKGKFNIPRSRKNSLALLTSLATLFAFLEPAELRTVIQKRIADSVSPHRPIECFLEFLQSGGEDVPRGKVKISTKRVQWRENLKEKKRQKKMGIEQQQGDRSSMSPAVTKSSVDAEPSSMHGVSSYDDLTLAVDPARTSSDPEIEDGEILPQLDSLACDPPRCLAQPSAPFSSRQGVAMPLADHIAGSGTVPPPKKKKKRRAGKAAHRAQRELQLGTSIVSPPAAGPEVFPGHFMPSASLTPMPGRSFTQFLSSTPGDPFHPDQRNISTF